MTRGRARRYLLTKQGYYPGVVARNFDVWDWSTLNENTLFQDSTKLIPAKDQNDPVGCWVDYVKKTDATQLSTPNKPGLDLASLNGLTTIAFNGNDLLATGNISISTFAVWLVAKVTNASSATVIQHGANIATSGMSLLSRPDANSLYATRSSTLSSKNLPNMDSYGWILSRSEHQGTNASILGYFNGVNVTTAGSFTNNVGTDSASLPLTIGARSGLIVPITGNIAQLCVVSPYPTDASIIANMERYINSKWGVY